MPAGFFISRRLRAFNRRALVPPSQASLRSGAPSIPPAASWLRPSAEPRTPAALPPLPVRVPPCRADRRPQPACQHTAGSREPISTAESIANLGVESGLHQPRFAPLRDRQIPLLAARARAPASAVLRMDP